MLAKNYQKASIISYLQSVTNRKLRSYLWIHQGGEKITLPIQISLVKSKSGQFYCKYIHEQYHTNEIKKFVDHEGRSNFYIEGGECLFQAEYHFTDPHGVHIYIIPDMIMNLERRKSVRYIVEGGDLELDLELQKESKYRGTNDKKFEFSPRTQPKFKLRKQINDISIGGLSVITSDEEKSLFVEGNTYHQCEIAIDKKKIRVNIKLVAVSKVMPDKINKLAYEGYKLSFAFSEISVEDKNYVDEYIARRIKVD